MSKLVLITGGAGFIGSHLSAALLGSGHRVRVLDDLSSQAHLLRQRSPKGLPHEVELVVGDVRDKDVVCACLDDVDAVIHLAAQIGSSQSMIEVDHYTSVNSLGTAVLMQALIDKPVSKLVLVSSMSVYGEGAYLDETGARRAPAARGGRQLRARAWEPRVSQARALIPVPTREEDPLTFASIYASSKHDQERTCLIIGRAYGIPTVVLRAFNVYGPRQPLSNPYSGVLGLFGMRIISGQAPLIYEDGLQRRDFVSVHDVVRACVLALETCGADGAVLNIGSGQNFSVREIAARMATLSGREDLTPRITGCYRTGDVRHCFADVTRASKVLGFRAQVDIDDGLLELLGWLQGELTPERVRYATSHARGVAV